MKRIAGNKPIVFLIVVATATVARIADGIAAERAQTGANRGSFEPTATLRPDDAADGRTAQAANDRTLLRTRSGGA